jgi:hypothetical protein
MVTTISSKCQVVAARSRFRQKIAGDHGSEFQRPAADRFIAVLDPAFRQKVFDIAKAQRKTEIEPHRVSNNIRRNSVSGIGNGFDVVPDLVPFKSRVLGVLV